MKKIIYTLLALLSISAVADAQVIKVYKTEGSTTTLIEQFTDDNPVGTKYKVALSETSETLGDKVDVSEITVTGNATMTGGTTQTLTADVQPTTANNRSVLWTSSNTDRAVVDPNTGVVTARMGGTVDITASANDASGVYKTFTLQVTTPQYVDLGLSVKWASCNLGASTPEAYGNYYAWGETQPYNTVPSAYPTTASEDWTTGSENSGYKSLVTGNTAKTDYSWSTYKWGTAGSADAMLKYKSSSHAKLEVADDAVIAANIGLGFRMPTSSELSELVNNCTWTWCDGSTKQYNGTNVRGYLVTAANGNSIFLPAAGYRDGSGLNNAGGNGYYWSSTLNSGTPYGAYRLFFYSGGHNVYLNSRYYGFSVRPVFSE